MVKGEKNGVKKGAWSEDEDNKLRAYIQRYGHWNWGLLPKFAGVSRSGKSCRLRWLNYLRPNIKHGNFTKEEDDLVIDLHNKLGNKWSTIATKLPGRSDNEIKNRWNTHLKKRAQAQAYASGNEHVVQPDHQTNLVENPVNGTNLIQLQQEVETNSSPDSPSYSLLTDLSSYQLGANAVLCDFTPQTFDDQEPADNTWTADPFLPDNMDALTTSPSADNLFSPFNFVYDFVSQSSCDDIIISDEFLWSTFDTFIN